MEAAGNSATALAILKVDIGHLLLFVGAPPVSGRARLIILCVQARLSEQLTPAQTIFRIWPELGDECQKQTCSTDLDRFGIPTAEDGQNGFRVPLELGRPDAWNPCQRS